MAKWRIICFRESPDKFIGSEVPTAPWAVIIPSYSNSKIGGGHRVIRIINLVSIAGKTPEDLGMTVPVQRCGTLQQAIITEMGEYNGACCHFIVIRPEVTLDDFEVVVLDR